MELDSQRGKLTTWEKEECMRRRLCFHCKDRGQISALCPGRTRIAEMEMETQLSENDGAQERPRGPLRLLRHSLTRPKNRQNLCQSTHPYIMWMWR